jgi:predicted ATPase
VGREAELASLSRRYEQTRRGRRQVLFVTGDAGMGKTALVDAFTEQLGSDEPVWVGQGQCVEQYGAGEAYLPLLEALSLAYLRQYAPSWLVQLPALVGAEDRAALQQQVQEVTQSRLLRELAEALEPLTTVQPAVFVLEEPHGSDVSTVEVLAMLARRVFGLVRLANHSSSGGMSARLRNCEVVRLVGSVIGLTGTSAVVMGYPSSRSEVKNWRAVQTR